MTLALRSQVLVSPLIGYWLLGEFPVSDNPVSQDLSLGSGATKKKLVHSEGRRVYKGAVPGGSKRKSWIEPLRGSGTA